MGSRLENISDEQLKKYMKYVYKVIGDLEFDGPNELYYYDNITTLFSPFGGNIKRLDVEYLYYVLKNNPFYFKEGYPINRPTLVDHDLTYTVRESQVVEMYYNGEIKTYIPDDLEEEYLNNLADDLIINPRTWNIDSEITDTEWLSDKWDF